MQTRTQHKGIHRIPSIDDQPRRTKQAKKLESRYCRIAEKESQSYPQPPSPDTIEYQKEERAKLSDMTPEQLIQTVLEERKERGRTEFELKQHRERTDKERERKMDKLIGISNKGCTLFGGESLRQRRTKESSKN